MARTKKNRQPANDELPAIAEIRVAGFKSISDEQSIDIKPLTILAGANSSGKSSMMQPLLLLKQTLEASYDPGPLLLSGPNVKFTSADQILSRIGKGHSLGSFHVGMSLETGDSFQVHFRKEHKGALQIERMGVFAKDWELDLWPEMTEAEIVRTGITKWVPKQTQPGNGPGRWQIARDRCFLEAHWVTKGGNGASFFTGGRPGAVWEAIIPRAIHLSGLRNPERPYPVTAAGPSYPGIFEKYTASIVSQWMLQNEEALDALNVDLKRLRLTGGVTAVRLNDVQIELHVGRLPDVPPTRPEDRINIADVGLGVSHTLPVLVALRAAKPGELVYVEQPETHLHPQAQFALAQILAAAAKRGVRVVVETHSTILLLGAQALVAEGSLAHELVKLHWFQRDKVGRTTVTGGDLDEFGAFGDWPQDFDDTLLYSQKRYLDAASKRMFAR